MRNSEAYERFMENLIGDNQDFEIVALTNGMVNQCVNLGFNHGMSEIETLRCAILALVKVSDEDLQRKMIEMLKSPSPSFSCNRLISTVGTKDYEMKAAIYPWMK